jgi:hypothetical protein
VAHAKLSPVKTDEILGTISLIAGERALLSSGEIREWTGRAWKIIPGDWRPPRPYHR